MKKLLMVLLLAGFAVTYTPVEAKHDKMDEFSGEFSEADQAELEKLIAELEQESGMPAGMDMEEADKEPSAKRQKTEEVDHVEW